MAVGGGHSLLLARGSQATFFCFEGTQFMENNYASFDPNYEPTVVNITSATNLIKTNVVMSSREYIFRSALQANHMDVRMYYCKPRKDIFVGEISGGTMAAGSEVLLNTGLTTWINNQFLQQEDSNKVAMTMATPGWTPFMCSAFCRKFKIIKSRELKLQPGGMFSLTLKRGERSFCTEQLGCYDAAGTGAAGAFAETVAMSARLCRFWLVIHAGGIGQSGNYTTGTSNVFANMVTGPSQLDWYEKSQWCVRSIPNSYQQPICEMVTAVPTAGGRFSIATMPPNPIVGGIYTADSFSGVAGVPVYTS